jgi:glycosyltransferase involved in cell wall biosynthesis
MKIGIAGPVSLNLLAYEGRPPDDLPSCEDAPIVSCIANGLLARGHEVVIYASAAGLAEPYVHVSPRLAICVGRRRGRHRARDLYRLERKDLVELMRAHPVDVIHAHWSYDYAWSAIDANPATLVTVHDHARTILKHSPKAFWLARAVMSGIVLRRARHLSAPSEYLYRLLTPAQRQRARVVPNFYPPLLDDISSGSCMRTRGLDAPVITTIANGFAPWKNVARAIRAFGLLRRKVPSAEFRLVGEDMGANGPARAYAMSVGLMAGVSFVGRLPYVQTLRETAAATVLLHPALEESFGMTVLEAMALGTPVVGGRDSGNIPHLLGNGCAGVLCDVRSPGSMADALLSLLGDPERATELSQRAGVLARERFSEEPAIEAYLRYYRDILERQSR